MRCPKISGRNQATCSGGPTRCARLRSGGGGAVWLPLVDDHDFRLCGAGLPSKRNGARRIGRHPRPKHCFRKLPRASPYAVSQTKPRTLLERDDKTTEAAAGRKRR